MDIKIEHVFSLAADEPDDSGTRNSIGCDSKSLYSQDSTSDQYDQSGVSYKDTVDGERPVPVHSMLTSGCAEIDAHASEVAEWPPDMRSGTDDGYACRRDLAMDFGLHGLNDSTDSADSDVPPYLSCEEAFDDMNVIQDNTQDSLDPPCLEPVVSEPALSGDLLEEKPDITLTPMPEPPKTCNQIYPCYIVLTDVTSALESKGSIPIRKFKRTYKECFNICKKVHFKRQLKAGKDVFNVKAPSKQKDYQYFLWKEENKRQLSLQFKKSKHWSQPFTVLTELLRNQSMKRRSKKGDHTGVGRIRRIVTHVPKDFIEEFKAESGREREKRLREKELLAEERQRILQEQSVERKLKKDLEILRKQVTLKRSTNQCVKQAKRFENESVPVYIKDSISSFSGRQRKRNPKYGSEFIRSRNEAASFHLVSKVEAMLKREDKKRKYEKDTTDVPASGYKSTIVFNTPSALKSYTEVRPPFIDVNYTYNEINEPKPKVSLLKRQLKTKHGGDVNKRRKVAKILSDHSRNKVLIQDLPSEEHMIDDFLREDGRNLELSGSAVATGEQDTDTGDRYAYAKSLLKEREQQLRLSISRKLKAIKPFTDTEQPDMVDAKVLATTHATMCMAENDRYRKACEEQAQKNKKFKIPEVVQKLFKKSNVKVVQNKRDITEKTRLNESSSLNTNTKTSQETDKFTSIKGFDATSLVYEPIPSSSKKSLIPTPSSVIQTKHQVTNASAQARYIPFTVSACPSNMVSATVTSDSVNQFIPAAVNNVTDTKLSTENKCVETKTIAILEKVNCLTSTTVPTSNNKKVDMYLYMKPPGNGKLPVFANSEQIIQNPVSKIFWPAPSSNTSRSTTSVSDSVEKLIQQPSRISSPIVVSCTPGTTGNTRMKLQSALPVTTVRATSAAHRPVQQKSASHLVSSSPVLARPVQTSASPTVPNTQNGAPFLGAGAVSLSKNSSTTVSDVQNLHPNLQTKSKFAIIKYLGKTIIVPIPIETPVSSASLPTVSSQEAGGSIDTSTSPMTVTVPGPFPSGCVSDMPSVNKSSTPSNCTLATANSVPKQVAAVSSSAKGIAGAPLCNLGYITSPQSSLLVPNKSVKMDAPHVQSTIDPKKSAAPVLFSGLGTKQAFSLVRVTSGSTLPTSAASHTVSRTPLSQNMSGTIAGNSMQTGTTMKAPTAQIVTVPQSLGASVIKVVSSPKPDRFVCQTSTLSHTRMSGGALNLTPSLPTASIPDTLIQPSLIKQEPIDQDEALYGAQTSVCSSSVSSAFSTGHSNKKTMSVDNQSSRNPSSNQFTQTVLEMSTSGTSQTKRTPVSSTTRENEISDLDIGKEPVEEQPKAFSESLSDRGERLRKLKALLKEKQQAVESIRLSAKKVTDSANE